MAGDVLGAMPGRDDLAVVANDQVIVRVALNQAQATVAAEDAAKSLQSGLIEEHDPSTAIGTLPGAAVPQQGLNEWNGRPILMTDLSMVCAVEVHGLPKKMIRMKSSQSSRLGVLHKSTEKVIAIQ